MRTTFTKLVPHNVESTMMAFLTTVQYVGEYFLGRYLALLINHFVGITTDNLDDLWILYAW